MLRCFIDSLIHCFIRSLVHWFIDSLLSLFHSFGDSLIHCLLPSSIHGFIGSLAHSFIDSNWFIDSFSQPCMDSLMPFHWHLNNHLPICCCTSQPQRFVASASQKLSFGPSSFYSSFFVRNFRPSACRVCPNTFKALGKVCRLHGSIEDVPALLFQLCPSMEGRYQPTPH